MYDYTAGARSGEVRVLATQQHDNFVSLASNLSGAIM